MSFWGPLKATCVSAILALTACDVIVPDDTTSLYPQTRPTPPKAPVARPAAVVVQPQSAGSIALATYYKRLENDLLVQGLLRQDGGGIDVPYNARNLADNFTQIALYDEYNSNTGAFLSQPTASKLRKWDQPIRMSVEFGPTVGSDQREQDRESIRKYSQRLSRLTGVPISQTTNNPNFVVMVLNEDDRLGFVPRVRSLVPGISDNALRAFADIPRSTLCLVFAFSADAASSSYSKAIAVVRGEHPDLLRLSCIHEELAQGMGLANDSPAARPSIFNDDEEFGLLTTHDEHLLQMLYDPRLKSGMTERDARPIINTIAQELTGSVI